MDLGIALPIGIDLSPKNSAFRSRGFALRSRAATGTIASEPSRKRKDRSHEQPRHARGDGESSCQRETPRDFVLLTLGQPQAATFTFDLLS
jgi:hypothetical protein